MSLPALLARLDQLRVFQQGDRRAPHKPLLLLLALARVTKGLPRLAPFAEWAEPLEQLLVEFAPPVSSRHQPELPYWHLRTSGLWVVEGSDSLPTTKGNFPVMAALRGTSAGLTEDVHRQLSEDRDQVIRAARLLLDRHFPPSLHEAIVIAADLDFWPDAPAPVPVRRPRQANFSREVRTAYEYRCAATGFYATLSGSAFAVEAAHIKWHSCGGPSDVSNGVLLNPLMHFLLDRGVWTLSDDRRILVSAEFGGSDETVSMVRGLHGKPLREPVAGYQPVDPQFIRWHREGADRVFRGRPLGSV